MNQITGVDRTIRHTQRAITRHPPTSAECLEPLQPPAYPPSLRKVEMCQGKTDPNLSPELDCGIVLGFR
jgi:hypothetical protein